MSNFIKKLQEGKKEKSPYFRKLNASVIDNLILIIIRYLLLSLCYVLWYAQAMQRFSQEIYQKYTIGGIFKEGSTGDIFKDFLSNTVFLDTIFIIFLLIILGAIYYTYSLTGEKSATLGMRIMKLRIFSTNDKKISVTRIITRYFLGLIPWLLYIIVLIMFSISQYRQAFAIMLVIYIWYEPRIIANSKGAIHDLICKVVIKVSESSDEKSS